MDLSGQEVRNILDETFYEIANALTHRENIKISNFGTFIHLRKRERLARKPKTKERLLLACVVLFHSKSQD